METHLQSTEPDFAHPPAQGTRRRASEGEHAFARGRASSTLDEVARDGVVVDSGSVDGEKLILDADAGAIGSVPWAQLGHDDDAFPTAERDAGRGLDGQQEYAAL